MRLKVVILSVLGLFLMASCSPSLYRLHQYDQVESLAMDTLFVIINSETEDTRVLEKYNQNKRVRKLQKQIDKKNNEILNAFEKHYRFSPYVVWDLSKYNYQLPNAYYTFVSFYEMPTGENGIEPMISLQIKDNQDRVVTGVAKSYNPSHIGYKGMVKNINKELSRLHKKGLKLQKK